MVITTRRSYVGVQVAVVSAADTYNLLDLINAVIAAETGIATGGVCPGNARELKLQAVTGNTGSIFVGDGKLVAGGTGRQAGEIPKGTMREYGTDHLQDVDLGSMYITAANDGDLLNVEVLVG